MEKEKSKDSKIKGTQNRNFSLPTTTAKPPMPQVKPPKSNNDKK